jgi:hypothetical protein
MVPLALSIGIAHYTAQINSSVQKIFFLGAPKVSEKENLCLPFAKLAFSFSL